MARQWHLHSGNMGGTEAAGYTEVYREIEIENHKEYSLLVRHVLTS